ncbi:MAG: hypothetical protein M1457_01360 [bacterium]|nr:hypothetical protein [bacterium]
MGIILYSAFLIGLGYYLRREAHDSAGFFLAGRRLGPWQVGLSLAATGFGGSAVLIASLMVYTHGLAGLWFTGSLAAGFCVLGLFFARRIRASGAHSLAHFAGLHYGEGVRRIVSALIVVVEVAFFGLTVKSFALLASPLFGAAEWLPTATGGLAGREPLFLSAITAVFVVYTLLGGQKADVVTDMIQYGLIALAFVGLLLPRALARADLAALPEGFLAFPFGPGAGPVYALNLAVLMGLPGIVGGDVFAKILSARDGAAARGGALIGAAGMAVLAGAVALLALCARAVLPGLADPTLAIPLLARELLHPALFQFVSLAFLSVLLSTGDSVLLTGATHLTLDVLRLGDEVSSATMRVLTALLAALGLGLALFYSQLLEIMKFAYTLLTAGLVAPILLALALEGRRRREPAKANEADQPHG